VRFPIVEPMNGQVWDASFTRVGVDSVAFVAGPEEWRFAVDAPHGRIRGARKPRAPRSVRATAPPPAPPCAGEAQGPRMKPPKALGR